MGVERKPEAPEDKDGGPGLRAKGNQCRQDEQRVL